MQPAPQVLAMYLPILGTDRGPGGPLPRAAIRRRFTLPKTSGNRNFLDGYAVLLLSPPKND